MKMGFRLDPVEVKRNNYGENKFFAELYKKSITYFENVAIATPLTVLHF